ncbi:cytochrome P450 family protein [Thalictrum thalictroides]|uniref:Cytochrome P450 family protein n=1 Tax=Thalictrum thalictroides TaxID=46969 RepID=A0A7J6X489_THATH|nr:cytochrome P450 family protein [Thalictrum thalictroides]
MPGKGSNPFSLYMSRSNSRFSTRFSILTLAIFVAMLIIWSIDGSTIRNSVHVWRQGRDYIVLKLHKPVNLTHNASSLSMNSTQFTLNLTQDSSSLLKNFTQLEPVAPIILNPIIKESDVSWILAEFEQNFSSDLLSRWLAPGGEPCRDSKTDEITIPSLDDQNSRKLPTGEVHEIVFQALDDSGNRRCFGGDYFEIDLSGESWKSRPPIKDFWDGSYSIKLQVHPDFAGEYNLTIVLLFRHFEGLRFSPERFVFWKELRQIPITFYKNTAQLPELPICQKADFLRDVWSGRWTRHGKNDDCQIDNDGRYRCLKADFPCQKPWCNGSLGSLESNGWVYSTHCSFKIFSADSAWECLQNRWIFFWGDSNHVDSIRNLLNFVLGLPKIPSVPRRFDLNFTNPSNKSQTVRITSIFNGHWNATLNYQGLNSLQNEEFRNLIMKYFSEETVPDTIIMNSGLHDGVFWKTVRRFIKGAEYASKFWEEVIDSVKQRGLQAPQLLYRTTIATGGYARSLAFNPNKMEAYNGIVLDKLKNAGILSGVIDDFDMTFPWHYDNRCNDGVHYGRAPAKAKWRDGKIGHQYFVDLMLGHVLLNALCARK